jgi:hypothetical protein
MFFSASEDLVNNGPCLQQGYQTWSISDLKHCDAVRMITVRRVVVLGASTDEIFQTTRKEVILNRLSAA